MRKSLLTVAAGLIAASSLVGCQTLMKKEPMMISAVQPGPGESVTLSRIVVLADVSGSLDGLHDFPLEKALLESFVKAMPDGAYSASINSFGGDDRSAWMQNPLLPFSREMLEVNAADLRFIGKSTPMSDAFISLLPDLREKTGRGALLLISDGRPQDKTEDLIEDLKLLASAHRAPFCVYTVCIGDDDDDDGDLDDRGEALMKKLSMATGCGGFFRAPDLTTAAGMEAMVRQVFFGAGMMSLDSDGDGVPDSKDECPNTPRGAKVDARGCWVIEGLHFDFDKAVIKPEFEQGLTEVAEVLRKNPGLRVRIDGHTDNIGPGAYNKDLSLRRANAVRQDLIGRGIDPARLTTMGFGESRPAVPNTSAANRYTNRRVELTVVQ